MATAAPEATEVVEEEPKKKKPIVLIIGGVVGLIVLIVGIAFPLIMKPLVLMAAK